MSNLAINGTKYLSASQIARDLDLQPVSIYRATSLNNAPATGYA
jgi:hypothetical protein